MSEEIDYNSKENKLAVFTAWLDGKPWQTTSNKSPGVWFDFGGEPKMGVPKFESHLFYRVKPTPKRVPLEAKDVPPGSVFRTPAVFDTWYMPTFVSPTNLQFASSTVSYKDLHSRWEIKRPGEGWKPCSKEIAE